MKSRLHENYKVTISATSHIAGSGKGRNNLKADESGVSERTE